jgi:hypothetical protein
MIGDYDLSRRDMLGRAGLSAGTVLAATVAASGKEKEAAEGQGKEEVPVTPPEDLTREHAVLSRLLLIYEKALAAGPRPADWPMSQLADAVQLVRTFIEDYHERSTSSRASGRQANSPTSRRSSSSSIRPAGS